MHVSARVIVAQAVTDVSIAAVKGEDAIAERNFDRIRTLAAQYAALVGKPATDPGVPPASPTVRHITPGMQVTMEFMPARLNLRIGPDGKITEITCG